MMDAFPDTEKMEGAVPLYRVWKGHRAENVSYSDACAMARMGSIPGIMTGPDGYSLLVQSDQYAAADAAMRRAD